MKKTKKIISVALVPCMVGSMMAGCSSSSSSAAADESKDTAATTQAAANKEEETTAEETTQALKGDNAASALFEALTSVNQMDAYKIEQTISMDMAGEKMNYDITTLADRKTGNVSVIYHVDLSDLVSTLLEQAEGTDGAEIQQTASILENIKDFNMAFSVVDGNVYVDFSSLYAAAIKSMDDDTLDQLDGTLGVFELSLDDIEKLTKINIPIGDLQLKEDDVKELTDAFTSFSEDIKKQLSDYQDEKSFVEQDGNEYIVTIDKTNVLGLTEKILAAADGNAPEIYDAFVSWGEDVEVEEIVNELQKTLMEEVYAGIEKATGTGVTEEQKKELEESYMESVKMADAQIDAVLGDLKDNKADYIQAFSDGIKEVLGSLDEAQKELDDNAADFTCKITVKDELKDKDKLSYVSEISLKDFPVTTGEGEDAETESISGKITISTTITELTDQIEAPKDATDLSDVIAIGYKIYAAYQTINGTGDSDEGETDADGNPVDPDVKETEADGNLVDPDAGNKDPMDPDAITPDMAESEYNVTINEGEGIVVKDYGVSPAFIVKPYEGFELYTLDCVSSGVMEYDDNFCALTIFALGEDYTLEEYAEMNDAKKVADGIYAVTDTDFLNDLNVYFSYDGYNMCVEYSGWEEDSLAALVGDDYEAFVEKVKSTITIVEK